MVVFLKARTPTWGDYAFHRLGTQRTFASSCTAGYFASDSAVQLPLNVTYNSRFASKANCTHSSALLAPSANMAYNRE